MQQQKLHEISLSFSNLMFVLLTRCTALIILCPLCVHTAFSFILFHSAFEYYIPVLFIIKITATKKIHARWQLLRLQFIKLRKLNNGSGLRLAVALTRGMLAIATSIPPTSNDRQQQQRAQWRE
jgi:hypothetical protein